MEGVVPLLLQCFMESASFWGRTLARNKRSSTWSLKGSARKGDWHWWCEGWAQGVGGMGSGVRYLSGLLTASRTAPFMYVHARPASVCVFESPCIITHGHISWGKRPPLALSLLLSWAVERRAAVLYLMAPCIRASSGVCVSEVCHCNWLTSLHTPTSIWPRILRPTERLDGPASKEINTYSKKKRCNVKLRKKDVMHRFSEQGCTVCVHWRHD